MADVRTRFAPSPTGSLHVGSARTALFNWAFARHEGGTLVLRIEDTDRERSTLESEEAVLDGLRWLGLDWDEGPVRQSEHAGRHNEVIETLLAKGRAYRCVCTREELDERREAAVAGGRNWSAYDGRCRDLDLAPDCGPHTVRLRLPEEGKLDWGDLVFGPSGQDVAEVGDMIIRRSDGQPLYNLAVVVDDLDMGITHVIRGADHHSNTPFQIAIYRALERDPPRFAHVPLIVAPDGKKLSKRHGNASVQDLRDAGYLAEAVRNWVARFGWSHGDQEVFSLDEIRELFELEGVSRASSQADPAKLAWLNQHYIKSLPTSRLLAELVPFLPDGTEPSADLERLIDLLRIRSRTLPEMAQQARWFLSDEIAYEEKAARKHLKPAVEPVLAELHERLATLDDWSEPALEAIFDEVRAHHDDIAVGKLAQPVRVALTGGTASPGIYETLAVLGKVRAVERIGAALESLRTA